jgi:protein tyrosine phosphatase (PTP) superfamily phosphohydrolase (DUF442 family)
MVKRTLLSLAALVIVLESYQLATESTSVTSVLANMAFDNNLHEVVPAKFFRASQMSPEDLRDFVTSRKIRTVIDLRMNPKSNSSAYQGDNEKLEQIGVSYRHFPLLGSKEMTQEQLLALLNLLDEVEEPIVVNCSSGTHRSGVVTAIYLMEKQGMSYQEAISQLSPKYGFIASERKLKSYFSGRPTIDNVIWRYGKARENNPELTFRAWVEAGME